MSWKKTEKNLIPFFRDKGKKHKRPNLTFLMPDNILLSSLISPQLFCLKALGACGKLLCDFYLYD